MEDKVLNVINAINKIESRYNKRDAKEVYLRGNCGAYYLMLSHIFEEAIPCAVFADNEAIHVLTKIDNNYYDAKGKRDADCVIKGYEFAEYRRAIKNGRNIRKVSIEDNVGRDIIEGLGFNYGSRGKSDFANALYQRKLYVDNLDRIDKLMQKDKEFAYACKKQDDVQSPMEQ